jgi:anti-anti-sigma factor
MAQPPDQAVPPGTGSVHGCGDLTIYAAAHFKETVLAALEHSSSLSIDLSEVAELDTAGLQVLILAAREASRAGKSVKLVSPSHVVTSTLALCGLDSVFATQGLQASAEERA